MHEERSDKPSESIDKFAEYTFFAENTQTLADRRQAATQIYIGVNTAIFGLIGFLTEAANMSGDSLPLLTGPLFAVGTFVCIVWDRTICRYRHLINWRFEQLMAMEKELPGSYRMFCREWEAYFSPEAANKKIAFSSLERWLPIVVIGLYIAYGAAFIF
ncbi:MAG: hypothetical protein HC826_02030 [Rhodospirillales bacterium]|nr:hypothetical protein [Rhodospirillales bacterium]